MTSFDYIVVGAGTAGCVIASRLSDDPALRVLLIEAGPPGSGKLTRTPLAFPRLFRSQQDWSYWTEAQPELGDRRLYWPRGKMLGGSGSMNAMVHSEPCRADLDGWRDAGCEGWGYADLRPKLDLAASEVAQAHPADSLNPLTGAFLEAGAKSDLPRVPYLRNASQPGCGPFRVNVRDGMRYGAREAYLSSAIKRGNLIAWTRVSAVRILFVGERAVGVSYLHEGQLREVHCTREVILCAGAVGSPQLLMLSGIGPEAHLAEHGIAARVDLAGVGANLQDHVTAPVSYFATQPVSLSGAFTRWNRLRHTMGHAGPLSSNGAEAGAFLHSNPEQKANAGVPCDVELLFAPVHYVDHGFTQPGGHGFSIIPILLDPHSRGTVRLYSSDPHEAPLIDPRYLTDHTLAAEAEGEPVEATVNTGWFEKQTVEQKQMKPRLARTPRPARRSDLARLVAGVDAARKMAQQEPLAEFRGASAQGREMPSLVHVRSWGQTIYHPVGTCRMGVFRVAGAEPDPVVDLALQVYGVVGLRVVDASVMPRIPRAHPNATVIAIAERAAELIRP